MKTIIAVYALLIVLVLGCVTQPPVNPTNFVNAKFEEEFNLAQGQTAKFSDNLEIKLIEIQDSRCPSKVTCVWQGEGKTILEIKQDAILVENITLTLDTNSSQTFTRKDKIGNQYLISLISIEPYPIAGQESSEKIAKLKVDIVAVPFD
ncbi:MAG: hypothetical protein Q7S92_06880 [Candidatus Diapherotrites archaeon]|nr:hypothetical protein [Candidatus Diapherotrites archaeon]